ncbi:MAG: hypothetical protein GX279_07495 [Clostridiaceae bacterium]|nr:hypothetical protein [Clostridiaceae bacterium]
MWKKLIAMTIALIIITGFTMTVFAGYDEGTGGISAPTSVAAAAAAAAARNSALSNETARTESGKDRSDTTSEQAAAADAEDKSEKSTYDDLEMTGPDAEFFAAIMKVLDEGTPVSNDLEIILITKPEAINGKVGIYSNKFSISVRTEFHDVIFSVARLNSKTGKYERIEFDGEKSINLACGTETKEAILEYGSNNLLFISYRDSEKQASKVQYNPIVVEVNREAAADKAISPENTIKKPSIDPQATLDSFSTIIDNLLGRGK